MKVSQLKSSSLRNKKKKELGKRIVSKGFLGDPKSTVGISEGKERERERSRLFGKKKKNDGRILPKFEERHESTNTL